MHNSWLWKGRNSLPCLPWRPVTDFCIIQIFEQLSRPEKQSFPKTFRCVEIFFILHDFWEFRKTCACPKKQSLLWNFLLHWNIFYLSGFEELALALKIKFVMKIFTVFNILFTFRMFEQLLLALKNKVCLEFTVLNMYFLSFIVLNNLRLPRKFSLHWNIFYLSGFEELALVLKTEFSLKSCTALNIVFIFRIFQQLVLALKNRVCPEFTVLNI